MHYDGIEFHNVAERRETRTGVRLQRIPESVRSELNEDAQRRYLVPSGSELRFVPNGEVSITLSCPSGCARVHPSWGDFRSDDVVTIGAEPESIDVSRPETLAAVTDGRLSDLPFSSRVARLAFDHHTSGPVHYHGVEGDVRPPGEDEIPDTTLLAYGTSITEGFAATGTHLSYPTRAARTLGIDQVNLGTAGSPYCESAIADHVAGREDWDLAVLSVSVNMLGAGFTRESFRERVEYLISRVAGEHPDEPIVPVTLFPLFSDVDPSTAEDGWEATPEAFRDVLRDVASDVDHDDVHLLEGPDLLGDPSGLTDDLVHPADEGMISIGENLARAIEPLLA